MTLMSENMMLMFLMFLRHLQASDIDEGDSGKVKYAITNNEL